jgi:hypothetical protein
MKDQGERDHLSGLVEPLFRITKLRSVFAIPQGIMKWSALRVTTGIHIRTGLQERLRDCIMGARGNVERGVLERIAGIDLAWIS